MRITAADVGAMAPDRGRLRPAGHPEPRMADGCRILRRCAALPCGFTLVELLVVTAIIAVLAGLATPMMSMARKGAKKSATVALLAKVDAGVQMFKQDVGVHPYQAIDPSVSSFPPVDNRLAYHLAREMSDAERTLLRTDADAAAAAYDTAPHRFTATTPAIVANQSDSAVRGANAAVVNRIGRERARLMIYAGHSQVTGMINASGTPLAPGATSKGWGGAYIAADIPARHVVGDAIVDSDGTPLLYVCPVLCGSRGVWAAPAINDGNARSFYIDPSKFGSMSVGRSTATSLASDIRTTAQAGLELAPEIWSLGPDRRGDALRDAPVNADNVPARPYVRGLPP